MGLKKMSYYQQQTPSIPVTTPKTIPVQSRYCYNCGKSGHLYNECYSPVMSYGGILYQLRDGVPYYLMVQRTYTPDFKELVRGKFELEDVKYIKTLISRITFQEINLIFSYNHKQLYLNIQRYCRIRKNRQYHQKQKQAKSNFETLLEGYTTKDGTEISFQSLVTRDDPKYYIEPDWGFPKGRRNSNQNEIDQDCATREIEEETGIPPSQYQIKPEYFLTEVYHGSNEIQYAHRYYLCHCQDDITYFIDPFNRHQAGEIRKMGWFTLEQALNQIRPYHIAKKKVLLRAHREITGQVIVVDFENNNLPIPYQKKPNNSPPDEEDNSSPSSRTNSTKNYYSSRTNSPNGGLSSSPTTRWISADSTRAPSVS